MSEIAIYEKEPHPPEARRTGATPEEPWRKKSGRCGRCRRRLAENRMTDPCHKERRGMAFRARIRRPPTIRPSSFAISSVAIFAVPNSTKA